MYRILYFGAPWCGQCKVLKPKVEDICKNRGISLMEYDASEHEDICAKWNIRNVPTLIVLLDDKEIARGIGVNAWELIDEKVV